MQQQDTYKLRDAVPADLPAIVHIYNSTIPGRMVTADLEPVTVHSRENWFAEHNPETRPIWVLEKDGKIWGWLSFQSFYGRPAYNGTAEVSIYLNEECRGRGLGRYLLEKAIAACPELGIKTVLGFIFGHNAHSLALFDRYGFAKWAELPRIAELDGIERDLIIMGKRVG
ncbi:GNAT family N-acetyltransferase [Paenibacillus chitinolyticus]|uniref:GNAT family N-acetyltransferase n=1 Tax=Paenibacillus chitinolyticus TaxID=79263 RepID=UPI00366F43E8